MSIDRRNFLGYATLGTAVALARPVTTFAATATTATVPTFELDEITVAELQEGMTSGRWSARSIAEAYLMRIDAIDKRGPAINAIIELNPDSLTIADALDRERKEKGPRGPLHGIPVLIKDNIDTADKMHTTAGSLALSENIAS